MMTKFASESKHDSIPHSLSDIRRPEGSIVDIRNVLDHFASLSGEIRAFCESCAEHYASLATLSPTATSLHAPLIASFVDKQASEFPSVFDYVFFILISIVNTFTNRAIFEPFHPALSKQDDLIKKSGYKLLMESGVHSVLDVNVSFTNCIPDLQLVSASWRSSTFEAIEASLTHDRQGLIHKEIVESIGNAFRKVISKISQDQLPYDFESRLKDIIESAYKWNTLVKRDILKYDFEPFIIAPGSAWDVERMDSFERVDKIVSKEVISTVVLGVVGRVALGGRCDSQVQLKAKVLVEEWFRTSTSRPRTNFAIVSQAPTVSNPHVHHITFAVSKLANGLYYKDTQWSYVQCHINDKCVPRLSSTFWRHREFLTEVLGIEHESPRSSGRVENQRLHPTTGAKDSNTHHLAGIL